MSNYKRVIPRDLFNEAKLLKCVAFISLLIHDEKIKGLNVNHEYSSKGFEIIQDDSDGSISIENLHFFDGNGTPAYFSTTMNDKSNFPLVLDYKGEQYFPFNEEGKYQLDKAKFL